MGGMTMRHPRPALAVAVFIVVASGFAAAQEKFICRMFTGGGPNQERVQNVRIEIDAYSTTEEIAQFADVLNKQGWEPFIALFRGSKKGTVRFMSTRGFNVTVHAAHSMPTGKGRKILLFTERQNWDADNHPIDNRGGYLFMVIELELNAKDKGEGKIYQQADIQFNENSTLAMKTYKVTPLVLFGVQPTK
jgi:hypothetical protein